MLENNCTQSIATSAGYVIAPLGAGLPAYMVMTGNVLPWWQMMVWLIVVSITGVLMAFPMKRRFINEDQLPFPEGRACGVVLDSLYTGGAEVGLFKARLLYVTAGDHRRSGNCWCCDGWATPDPVQDPAHGRLGRPEGAVDRCTSTWTTTTTCGSRRCTWRRPKILGTDIRQLGLRFSLDFSMLGVGGLMGVAVATSVLLGAILNLAILAPIMIEHGDIVRAHAGQRPRGAHLARRDRQPVVDLVGRVDDGGGRAGGPVRQARAVHEGVQVDVARWPARREPRNDVLKHIEVPLWVSWIGVPVFSLARRLGRRTRSSACRGCCRWSRCR